MYGTYCTTQNVYRYTCAKAAIVSSLFKRELTFVDPDPDSKTGSMGKKNVFFAFYIDF
jgi:hypothetical protein